MAKRKDACSWFDPEEPATKLFVGGATHKEIASILGLTVKAVDSRLRRNRLELIDCSYEEVVKDLLSGKSIADIANSRNVYRSHITKLLKYHKFNYKTLNLERKKQAGLVLDEADIVSTYKAGDSLDSIASRLGVSYTIVKGIVQKAGLPIRVDGLHQIGGNLEAFHTLRDAAKLRQLYVSEGLTASQIGVKLGVSDTAVLRWLKRHEIARRHGLEYANKRKLGSPHERLIQYLDANNIQHQSCYVHSCTWNGKVKKWEMDEYVPSMKMFIEVQGTHWHGHAGRSRLYKNVRAKMWSDLFKFKAVTRDFPDHKILYLDENFTELELDRIFKKLSQVRPKVAVAVESIPTSDANRMYETHHYLGKCTGPYSYGAFVDGKLVAAVTYARPHRQNIGPRGYLELVRLVSLDSHGNVLTRLLSGSLKALRSMGVAGVFTYSDPTPYNKRSHSGAVYKAANFKYTGLTQSSYAYVGPDGKIMNKKSVYNRAVKAQVKEAEYAKSNGLYKIPEWPKLRFEYPLE